VKKADTSNILEGTVFNMDLLRTGKDTVRRR